MKPSLGNTFPHALALVLALFLVMPALDAPGAGKVVECTVILDQATGEPIVRSGTCDERFTPMCRWR